MFSNSQAGVKKTILIKKRVVAKIDSVINFSA